MFQWLNRNMHQMSHVLYRDAESSHLVKWMSYDLSAVFSLFLYAIWYFYNNSEQIVPMFLFVFDIVMWISSILIVDEYSFFRKLVIGDLVKTNLNIYAYILAGCVTYRMIWLMMSSGYYFDFINISICYCTLCIYISLAIQNRVRKSVSIERYEDARKASLYNVIFETCMQITRLIYWCYKLYSNGYTILTIALFFIKIPNIIYCWIYMSKTICSPDTLIGNYFTPSKGESTFCPICLSDTNTKCIKLQCCTHCICCSCYENNDDVYLKLKICPMCRQNIQRMDFVDQDLVNNTVVFSLFT